MQADKVSLFRRRTGGGAVYQDLGNTCFSFINPKSPQDYKTLNNSMILRALQSLDIEAEPSGRNDLLVEGKKISGSAYKVQNHGSALQTIHHGTMLINTEKQALLKYLNPNKAKLESKGVTSVASRVSNLVEFNPSITGKDFIQAMAMSFTKHYSEAEVVHLEGIPPAAAERAKEYEKWEWVYGESPHFSHHLETRFKWGIVDMHLDVMEGVVEKCKIFSDCLYPEFIESMERDVIKQRYGKEMIGVIQEKALNEFKEMAAEMGEWLSQTI